MGLEEDLLLDAQTDAAAVEYIRKQLSDELNGKFSDEVLFYFIDLLADYYTESGILDAEPDEEGFVDIPIDAVAEYLQEHARKEEMGNFEADELIPVIEAELDFNCLEE